MASIKVAKSGYSVDDGEEHLAFTSDRNCIMEFASGLVDINTDGSGYATTSVTHNLGYRPGYYGFVRDALHTDRWYPHNGGSPTLLTSVDTTKLYFTVNYEEPSALYKVFYTIWGNQQNDAEGSGNNNVSGKIRVAKPGYNARTETDLRNMRFASGHNIPKIDENLSGSITRMIDTGDITVITINHSLGYVPVVYVLAETYGQMLPSSSFAFPSFNYYITSTQVVIEVADFSGDPFYDCTFKYKILRDKII